MFTYEYENIESNLNWATRNESDELVSGIYKDIQDSEMAMKNCAGHLWEEESNILHVYFVGELSAGDKSILDGIVASNT